MHPFELLLARNRTYATRGAPRPASARPSRQLAIVTCMDTRIEAAGAFGLEVGEAHILRNAGGRVTEDVLRSLTLSTHLLGTRAVAVVAHTDCGLTDPRGDLADRLAEVMGRAPAPRAWGGFTDPAAAVTADSQGLLRWPDRPHGLTVAGYVLDVDDGRLVEVVAPTVAPDPA